ncbi:MAG: HD domain-containing protein [Bacteroidia bacterium]|nr:HD domain-containing protein [Bacteroidia bacterium]
MADFEGAKKYILGELGSKLPENLTYHGLWHTKSVYKATCDFSEYYQLNERDRLILETAALYHDCGFLNVYRNHEEAGCIIASEVLPKFGYTQDQISEIHDLIMATKIPQSPKEFLSELICDADLDYLGGDDYERIADRLFEEFKEYHIVATELQWFEMQAGFLESHTFFSEFSRNHRNPKKIDNLLIVKKRLEKLRNYEQ